ncbi:hypothetical protein KKB18_04665, partial [bacterium]|nr:hypothetical protein [bacterium]
MKDGYKIQEKGKFQYVSFDILYDEGVVNACTGKWVKEKGKKEIFSFSKKQDKVIYNRNIDILMQELGIKPDLIANCDQVH